MKHQLSIELPDTNNTKILRVIDTSIYADDIPVKCGILQITSPGFLVPVQIEVTPGFNLILNGCTLGVSSDGTDLPCLADGLYKIQYSVSPNDKVYVEYNYLRAATTVNKYFQELCQIELSTCDPSSEIKANLKELRLIKSFIDAAKAKVEYCNSPHVGMEIFTYAQKRLSKYTSCCEGC